MSIKVAKEFWKNNLYRKLFKNELRNTSNMLRYPAAERNKEPILNILKQILSSDHKMRALEIGSGSGQHIAHFASHFANIEWQPSDVDERLFESIESYAKHNNLSNLLSPILLDVSSNVTQWPVDKQTKFDLIICSNVIHISPWKCTLGLFEGTSALLKDGTGLLITYGPYAVDGILTPESNVNFDISLRSQNPEWGVRDIRDLKQLAEKNKMIFVSMHCMPANNKVLIFRKL